MDSQYIILILSIFISLLTGIILTWLSLRKRLQTLDSEKNRLGMEHSASVEKSSILEKELTEAGMKLENLRRESSALERSLAEEKTRRESESARMLEYKEEIKLINEKMSKEFELISHRLMEKNAESFATLSKDNVNSLLNPFGERLKNFEGIIRDTYQKGLVERSSLMEEIQRLHNTNQSLGEDAKNLTRALKGDSKVRGNWGEIILERVLERSGLRKGEEYTTQESLRSENNERFQPDVVIHLPDKKHIVVDSKVSLVAYENYLSEEDETLKERHMKQHILSVRNHVKELSSKGYQYLEGIDAPEFVMMFIPIEASFSLTIQADADLFQDAWQQRIIIVSPTTLLATLRTVASIWQHEKQTRNAITIAKEGGALVDKLRSAFLAVEKLGTQLGTAMKTHNDLVTKFDGKGGLLPRANKMQQLGARAKKVLSSVDTDIEEELIPEADIEDNTEN